MSLTLLKYASFADIPTAKKTYGMHFDEAYWCNNRTSKSINYWYVELVSGTSTQHRQKVGGVITRPLYRPYYVSCLFIRLSVCLDGQTDRLAGKSPSAVYNTGRPHNNSHSMVSYGHVRIFQFSIVIAHAWQQFPVVVSHGGASSSDLRDLVSTWPGLICCIDHKTFTSPRTHV